MHIGRRYCGRETVTPSTSLPQMVNMIVRDDQGLKFTLPTVRAIVAWELSNSLSLLSTHDN